MAYPDTNDAVEEISLLPDWGDGISVTFNYRNSTIPTLGGFDQVVRQHARCRYGQIIQRTTEDAADNDLLTFGRTDQAKKPLRIPLWSHGVTLSAIQPSETVATTDIGIADIIAVGDRIVLYDPTEGLRWKTMASIADARRSLTFDADVGAPLFPQGAWLFPTFLCTLELADDWRQNVQTQASRESLNFLAT